jgi:hypothetical protein
MLIHGFVPGIEQLLLARHAASFDFGRKLLDFRIVWKQGHDPMRFL